VRYHDYLLRRYVNRDLAVRLSLATSAVVVFVGIRLVPTSTVWPTASGVIALISTTIVPLFKWNKLIPAIDSERLRWIQLLNDYSNLWNDTKVSGQWDSAAKDFKKLRKKDNDFERTGPLIPRHNDLLQRAQRDMQAAFMPQSRTPMPERSVPTSA
jgi:hypothetical protein